MSFVASCAVFQDILPLIDVPRWPPKPTLLTDDFGILKLDFENQKNWGADEWKKYAQYLEQSGQALKNDLVKTKRELATTKAKLRRGNKQPPVSLRTLLGGLDDEPLKPKPKRGRKPGSQNDEIIKAVEDIAKQTSRPVKQIINELLVSKGHSQWRAERDGKTILKRLYKLRGQSPNN